MTTPRFVFVAGSKTTSSPSWKRCRAIKPRPLPGISTTPTHFMTGAATGRKHTHFFSSCRLHACTSSLASSASLVDFLMDKKSKCETNFLDESTEEKPAALVLFPLGHLGKLRSLRKCRQKSKSTIQYVPILSDSSLFPTQRTAFETRQESLKSLFKTLWEKAAQGGAPTTSDSLLDPVLRPCSQFDFVDFLSPQFKTPHSNEVRHA